MKNNIVDKRFLLKKQIKYLTFLNHLNVPLDLILF